MEVPARKRRNILRSSTARVRVLTGLRVCQKIRDCGGNAEFYIVVGGGHGNGQGRKPGIEPDFCGETVSVMEEFFKKYVL